MSYVTERTYLLVKVLERAATLPEHRLAGYAMNAEFWAEEISHSRRLLDGYYERFDRMKSGTENYLRDHPAHLNKLVTGQDADTRTQRSAKDSDIAEARKKLDAIGRKLFLRMQENGLLSEQQAVTINRALDEELLA